MKRNIMILSVVFMLSLALNSVYSYTEKMGNVSGQTWAAGTYLVTGNIFVDYGTKLTISAGAVVKFQSDLSLMVRGTLEVNGTSGSPVIFTSRDDNSSGENVPGSDGSPSPGDWAGILLDGWYGAGVGNFNYCNVRYGGSYYSNVRFSYSNSGYFRNSTSEYSSRSGIFIDNCSPEIKDSKLNNNKEHAIWVDNIRTLALTGNTASNNLQGNGVGTAGNVKANTTLSSNLPFCFWGLTVDDGVTLTIPEGMIIKFPQWKAIRVLGTLDVNGTHTKPVIFTSIKDDTGGDTNNDGNTTSPSPGDWDGILLDGWYGVGIGQFDYCNIRYGGNYYSNVTFYYSQNGYFRNSISEFSNSQGIKVDKCSPMFRGNQIRNNKSYGVYITGGFPDLGGDSFTNQGGNTFLNNDNGNYQVYNESWNPINAYYNYWGYNTAAEIDSHIRDDNENSNVGEVHFEKWLTGPQRALILEKNSSTNFVTASGVIGYVLNYINVGGTDLTGVTIDDTLPANLNPVIDSISGGGTYNPASRRITWNIGSLNALSGLQMLTFRATVAAGVPNGTIVVNTASIKSTQDSTPVLASASTNVSPPDIVSISPNTGGNKGIVTVKIQGQYLDSKADVSLTRTGQSNIIANYVNGSQDGTNLEAAFDLTGKAPGLWNVVVTNSGGGSDTLPNAFTIKSGGEPHLWVSIPMPNNLRFGRANTVMVTCGNSGTVDIARAAIEIKAEGAFLDSPCNWFLEDKPSPFNENELIFIVFNIPAGSSYSFPITIRPTDPDNVKLYASGIENPKIEGQSAQSYSDIESLIIYGLFKCWDKYDVDISPGASPPPWAEGSILFSHSSITGHAAILVKINGEWFVAENQLAISKKWQDKGYPNTGGTLLFRWEDYKERVRDVNGTVSGVMGNLTNEETDNMREWLKQNSWPYGTPKSYSIPFYKCTEFVRDAFQYGAKRTILPSYDVLMPPSEMHFTLTCGDLMPGYGPNILMGIRAFVLGGHRWGTRLAVNIAYQALVVGSRDPNDKLGPAGFDIAGTPQGQLKRFIPKDHQIGYVVMFENMENATAPAQEVHVTDQLDDNLDWNTYELTGIQIGDAIVPIEPGSQTLSTMISAVVKLKDLNDPKYPDVPPLPKNVKIKVNCKFNPANGKIEWHFIGYDGITGELADFLPPNVSQDNPATPWNDIVAPHGEAWISYNVKAKENLPNGSQLKNRASIVFDVNDPIDAPKAGYYVNTIDSVAPTSNVKALPVKTTTFNIKVEWTGTDNQNGSGIANFIVYFSEDGGDFNVWLSSNETSAIFRGKSGHTYQFYSRARDNVGNIEDAPAAPDAFTTVEVSGCEMKLPEGWSLISFPINNCYYYETAPNDQPNTVNLVDVKQMGYKSLVEWFSSVITPNKQISEPSWVMVYGISGGMGSMTPSAANTLKYMSPCSGYWVKINKGTGGATLFLDGSYFATNTPIPLLKGWNLVGCPIKDAYYETATPPVSVRLPEGTQWKKANEPVSGEVFKSILGKLIYIFSEYGVYSPNLPPGANSMKYIAPGYGYWIKVSDSTNLLYSAGTGVGNYALAPPDNWNLPEYPVPPTRTAMLIYGDITGYKPAVKGAKVQAFSQSGVLCGQTEVNGEGSFGLMLVYGDDDETTNVEGARSGEGLRFYIDGEPTELDSSIKWLGDKVIQRISLSSRPKVSKLLQNYPNPFNPETWIPYQLNSDAEVEINIYTMAGQLARTLRLGYRVAGFYTSKERAAYWDGRNEAGERVSSGVYFYSIKAGDLTDIRKMVIMR